MIGVKSDANKALRVPIAALVPRWGMTEGAVGVEWRCAVLTSLKRDAAANDVRVDAGAAIGTEFRQGARLSLPGANGPRRGAALHTLAIGANTVTITRAAVRLRL